MDLKLLREATRPEHEATELAVPLTGPGLTRERYVAVLQRFHTVVCAWDTVAAAEAPPEYAALVQERRRCGSLEADLRFFGAAVEANSPRTLLLQMRELIGAGSDAGAARGERTGTQSEAIVRSGRFLGAMYVLEGSTLGGQYIAHQLESELGLTQGEGDRFFRGYGKETMPKWREFQQALLAVPDEEGETVIAAAKAMFGIFQQWMSRSEPLPYAINPRKG